VKVSVWVDLSRQVDVDVSVDDIRSSLSEAFAEAEQRPDRVANIHSVMRAMNQIAGFLNAFTEQEIDRLNFGQRSTISAFLSKQAQRFQISQVDPCSRWAGHDGPCNGTPRADCRGGAHA
jgi:hypothetical protein